MARQRKPERRATRSPAPPPRKGPTSFRLSDATRARLSALARAWEMPHLVTALERAVREAYEAMAKRGEIA